MDQEQPFYPRVIDRTPYGSCFLLAALGIAIFAAGCFLIWQLGNLVKRQDWFRGVNAPGQPPTAQDSASSLFDEARGKVEQNLQESSESVQDRLRDAAQAEVDRQTENLKQQGEEAIRQEIENQTDTLKQNLPLPTPFTE